MRKIDVFINGSYKFSTNRYKTCRECLGFLKSKSFVFMQGSNGKTLVELYNNKIECSFA